MPGRGRGLRRVPPANTRMGKIIGRSVSEVDATKLEEVVSFLL